MSAARWLTALLVLVPLLGAEASISGPTSSSGPYTLTWPDDGQNLLREVQSQTDYFTSPTTFSNPAGTYDYEYYLHIFAPEFGINGHFLIDTHQVVVTEGGDPADPPPSEDPHVVRVGDLGSNGLLDFAITAASPGQRLIEDFILRQTSPGVFEVLVNPTLWQLQQAANWPLSGARAIVTELNMNGQLDVALVDARDAIPGASDYLLLADPSVSTDYPTVSTPITPEKTAFIEEVYAGFADPNYLANAITQQCVSQSGWYLVTAFITQPGWYWNEHFQQVYISQPGFYTVYAYLQANQCFDVIDTNVVESLPGYYFFEALERFVDSSSAIERIDAANVLEAVLQEILGTPVGPPATQGPHSDIEAAERGFSIGYRIYEALCMVGFSNLDCTAREVARDSAICYLQASPQDYALLGTWRMPAVPHPPGQNFQITAAQQAAFNSDDRLGFWSSRLDDSRDPLGPLGIAIVNNEILLGCLANQRLLSFAAMAGVQVDLDEVGLALISEHIVETTALPVSATTIAEYHHLVFNQRGLPNRTFGGTPLTGIPLEALATKWLWCRSCD